MPKPLLSVSLWIAYSDRWRSIVAMVSKISPEAESRRSGARGASMKSSSRSLTVRYGRKVPSAIGVPGANLGPLRRHRYRKADLADRRTIREEELRDKAIAHPQRVRPPPHPARIGRELAGAAAGPPDAPGRAAIGQEHGYMMVPALEQVDPTIRPNLQRPHGIQGVVAVRGTQAQGLFEIPLRIARWFLRHSDGAAGKYTYDRSGEASRRRPSHH